MSDHLDDPKGNLPLRPVHPPEPPLVASPSLPECKPGAGQVALGFGIAVVAGVLACMVNINVAVFVIMALLVVGLILAIVPSTRKFGLGMLLALGVAFLIFLAICGGALLKIR